MEWVLEREVFYGVHDVRLFVFVESAVVRLSLYARSFQRALATAEAF